MLVSIEFFPPDVDKGLLKLRQVATKMAVLQPEYFSVTYGAGGSTKNDTYRTVETLIQAGFEVAPHLSFDAGSEQEVEALLDRYVALGIRRVVTLRGDVPEDRLASCNKMRHASELVRFIRQRHQDHFRIEVAAYPETHPAAASAEADLQWLKAKIDAGANAAITQYFYNCDAYEDFINRCSRLGLNVPIVPGVMPITNYARLVGFSKKCGAEIPRWILKRLEQYQDDTASLRSFGVEVVTALCERLQSLAVPGIHFYSMNQSKAVLAICRNLGMARLAD